AGNLSSRRPFSGERLQCANVFRCPSAPFSIWLSHFFSFGSKAQPCSCTKHKRKDELSDRIEREFDQSQNPQADERTSKSVIATACGANLGFHGRKPEPQRRSNRDKAPGRKDN